MKMKDQSFNEIGLEKLLRRSDFKGVLPVNVDAHRKALITGALSAAETKFGGANPIRPLHIKNKPAYGFNRVEDEVVVRRLTKNFRNRLSTSQRGRDFVIKALVRVLEEGVPYRIYRFDVRSFYESISAVELSKITIEDGALSPQSKHLLDLILTGFLAVGGTGVPRGMGLSAVLSELVMQPFDRHIQEHEHVFFYVRYVDDILIVTSCQEDETEFLKEVSRSLPRDLVLNDAKTQVITVAEKTGEKALDQQLGVLHYLGYKFSIFETPKKAMYRRVVVDIADSKVARIKLRIMRSFYRYSQDGDFILLRDRLGFLTANFSIADKNTGRRRLAGIYHGYPRITEGAQALDVLDAFLRTAVLKKKSRVFASTAFPGWTTKQARALLGACFKQGFKDRKFIHFHPKRIAEIQRCWIYE
jgi:hypothetical protein